MDRWPGRDARGADLDPPRRGRPGPDLLRPRGGRGPELSSGLFQRAERVIPGGVNSPVRAFGAVGGTPPFIVSGRGPTIRTADGAELIDYVQSWGALLFGHAREEIVAAAVEATRRGTTFGAPTEAEVVMAERLADMVPSVDRVRLVSSGTEAAMSAIRLARGFTGRDKVVKFAGCYHGHADPLLVQAGSGPATLGIPGTPGITEGAAGDTIVAPFNDPDAVGEALDRWGDRIAAVIIEPVAANMGVVPPADGFLDRLRDLTAHHGALLIFDEVITGFRLARGGAQQRFGIRPDLSVLGKVMGGGFPCAAFGGRAEVMDTLAPSGPVYQAGTLSGNPVAVAAGLATLDLIDREDPYRELDRRAESLADGIGQVLDGAGIAHSVNRVGPLLSVFFGDRPVADHDGARAADHDAFARFFHAMLDRGVYLPPSGYEAWFPGAAHGDHEVDRTLEAVRGAASVLRSEHV
ncbi:MAG TPA: glutamate-1-semialdehyde 2,1-aminomutase [Actinomycetota bacterium]|nr:glutamate-1-semialdehyde 2,1-aminomutase [Actinomycetota bacterium]